MLREGETWITGYIAVCRSGVFSSLGETIGAQALWQVVENTMQLRSQ